MWSVARPTAPLLSLLCRLAGSLCWHVDREVATFGRKLAARPWGATGAMQGSKFCGACLFLMCNHVFAFAQTRCSTSRTGLRVFIIGFKDGDAASHPYFWTWSWHSNTKWLLYC